MIYRMTLTPSNGAYFYEQVLEKSYIIWRKKLKLSNQNQLKNHKTLYKVSISSLCVLNYDLSTMILKAIFIIKCPFTNK